MNVCFLRNQLCLVCLVFFVSLSGVAQNSDTSTAETSDLAVAKVRQTLAAQRAQIISHPHDPSSYVNLAYTLTDAGINDQARQEVMKATQVAPNSAFAYNAQAWILHHNIIGINYGKGFDYDASLASYRKAIELDPSDLDIRQSLANLLEFNRDGIRYAADSQLDEAIEAYRYVKAHDPSPESTVEDNLAIDLFYAGRFNEALSELSTLQSSPTRDGISIAAIAAVQGPEAAIRRANAIDGDEQKKKDALNFAAEGLWNIRLYPQAAAILTASLPDTSNSQGLLGKIQIFRNLKPYHGTDLPKTDPRYPVQKIILSVLTDTLTESIAAECISAHASPAAVNWKQSLPQMDAVRGEFWNLSRQTGLPLVVIQDIVLGIMKISTVPSPQPGSRVLLEFAGLPAQSFFVVREDGSYKIVASKNSKDEVGIEALYLVHHDREAEARSLLDWKRDLIEKGQGDDPLGGVLFARLWTVGESKGPLAIELAAASLSPQNTDLLSLLPKVLEARKKANTETQRDNIDLLLASIYLATGDSNNATRTSQQLLNRYPDSVTALVLAGRAYNLKKDWPAWKSLLDARLQKYPNNRELLLQSATESEAQGDFARARRSLRIVLDSGHALADDYNTYAWLGLFDDTIDDQAVAAAQQANLLTQNRNAAYLHTLACVEAARGETAEARQSLLQAMSSAHLAEPNSAIWYGFGRIYEQYGVDDAAVAAYQRVKRPDGFVDPIAPYVLAQARLKILQPKH